MPFGKLKDFLKLLKEIHEYLTTGEIHSEVQDVVVSQNKGTSQTFGTTSGVNSGTKTFRSTSVERISTASPISLNIGTLVADDSGLRKLSDVLHKFNLERQGRRA